MASSALAALHEAHAMALHVRSGALQSPVMGLHVGARRLRLSAGMTRRVRNLEVACSMMRHASQQMTTKFIADLQDEVR
eukprot:4625286-Prorocentrum_lima.AAC.1